MIHLPNRITIIFCTLLVITSCSKNGGNVTPTPTIVKEWTITMSAKYENPAPIGRTETGTALLQLLSDNSLKYSITVSGLAVSDAMTAAHLHVGDAITSGPVILGLDPVFSSGTATGAISNLRSSLIDSLKSSVNEIYINAHSTQVSSGLIRGQLNTNIEMAADVALSGTNEVPAVTTTATGLALFRVTSEKKLYAKYTITNLEAGDAFTAAHIHKAASGINGPVLVGIYSSAADFGTSKVITLDDATYTSLKTDAIYANAHTVNKPAGLVRGQIR